MADRNKSAFLNETDTSDAFFIIWNPRSQKPPTVQFTTKAEAERVAEVMARKYGEPFYVMKGIKLFERSNFVNSTVLK